MKNSGFFNLKTLNGCKPATGPFIDEIKWGNGWVSVSDNSKHLKILVNSNSGKQCLRQQFQKFNWSWNTRHGEKFVFKYVGFGTPMESLVMDLQYLTFNMPLITRTRLREILCYLCMVEKFREKIYLRIYIFLHLAYECTDLYWLLYNSFAFCNYLLFS